MLEKSDVLVFEKLGSQMGETLTSSPYIEAASFWKNFKEDKKRQAQTIFYASAEKARNKILEPKSE